MTAPALQATPVQTNGKDFITPRINGAAKTNGTVHANGHYDAYANELIKGAFPSSSVSHRLHSTYDRVFYLQSNQSTPAGQSHLEWYVLGQAQQAST